MRDAVGKLIKWAYLLWVTALLVGFSVAEFIITFVYDFFPFPELLDWAFQHSQALKASFSYRLSGGDKDPRCLMNTPELVRDAGYGCEEHSAITPDGYVLVLHRVIPPDVERVGSALSEMDEDEAAEAPQRVSIPAEPAEELWADPSDLQGDYPLTPSRLPAIASPSLPHGDSGMTRRGSGQRSGRSSGGSNMELQASGSAWAFAGWQEWKRRHPSSQRPPVLLVHGLMQDSECFVCNGQESLAFILYRAGYDVWLGNNRGNRYSSKHISLRPDQDAFWNYSIDELARNDIPTMIRHILLHTGHSRLAYVGFSQGTAQAFAALSSHPDLARRVVCFAALSPAISIRGLQQSPLTSLVQADLGFFNLLFGERRMLPSAATWQQLLSTRRWVWLIDRSLKFLFNWDTRHLDPEAKPFLYTHLYSFASVKCVVHWFQMMRSGRFQMFDDTSGHGSIVPPRYDVGMIRCPIAAFVGGADTVIDIRGLLHHLPKDRFLFYEPTYEHLDFLWGREAPHRAFPALVHFLDFHHGRRPDAPVSHRIPRSPRRRLEQPTPQRPPKEAHKAAHRQGDAGGGGGGGGEGEEEDERTHRVRWSPELAEGDREKRHREEDEEEEEEVERKAPA